MNQSIFIIEQIDQAGIKLPDDFWITGNVFAERKPMTSSTPEKLAKELLSYHKFKDGHIISEPCAGRGGIVKEILNSAPESCEIQVNEINQELTKEFANLWYGRIKDITHEDYVKSVTPMSKDHIIFNPPFDKAAHFLYNSIVALKEGGQLSCLYPSLFLARTKTYSKLNAKMHLCKEIIIRSSDFDCDYGAKTCIIHLTK